ncbi:C4b-binding protein alpha chain-like, partial [Rhinatrema bivittatum]|uniref:C4b-binding protein alpha chain-like n=1 Tax=Rhinatrema bivittatum TaxID=194408 RepID=UPI0011281D00
MVGKSERKCLHSGSWSNVVPMCDPVICENPAEIADGTHSGKGKDEFTYQSSVTYRCNGPSLSLIGEPSIFCTENGTWSANPPTCKDIRCPFPEIKDGQVTSRIQPYYRLGEQITFRCNFAFIINGSNQVACGTDDNWLPRHPECLKRVSCPEPEIKNGNITQGVKERFHSGLEVGYSVFSSVSFACHPRYVLVGAKTSKCQKDIRWSPNVPTCKLRSSCPEPEIENGIITHGTKQHFHFEVGYRLHSSVSFACNPGYVLIGQNTSECQQDTRWLPDTPTCKPRESCTEPALEYGQVRRGKSEAFKSGWEIGYEVNASVTLQCNPPHVMEGSGEIVCGSDLKWHPSVPTCVESCPEPEVEHGYITHRNENLVPPGLDSKSKVYESVSFECNPGYSRRGARTIQCTPQLSWEPAIPTCEAVKGPTTSPPEGSARECEKVPGGFAGLCEAVEKRAEQFCVGEEPENYKTILEMRKLCLEIQKLQLEMNKLQSCSVTSASAAAAPALPATDLLPEHGARQGRAEVQGAWRLVLRLHVRDVRQRRALPTSSSSCEREKEAALATVAGALYCIALCALCSVSVLAAGRGSPEGGYGEEKEEDRRALPGRHPLLAELLLLLPAGRRGPGFSPLGDCGIPPSITNALLKEEYAGREAFSAGSVVSYECDQATGYGKKPGMSDTITCLDNSTWSEIPTFCERTCNSPTRFFFAELQSEFTAMNLFPVGTTVSYDCRPGYRLTRGMPTSITCLQNLTWSVIAPFCERRSCGSPGELLNGGVDLDDNLFGSTAKFYCNPGYQIVGRSTRQCLSSGSWSNVVPTCDPVICGSPPNIEGGTHSGSEKEEFRYSSAVTYSCTSNELTLIGDASIYCTQYGNWSGNPPKCKVVSCTDPVVKNGRKISDLRPPINTMFAVQFECNPGFTLSGDSLIKCDENSNWYPPVPLVKL